VKTLTALLLSLAMGFAHAQAYPSKAIVMVVPLQAGTAVDTVARMLAPKLSERLGQPIIIENQPGAAGQIGSERIVRAAPDGYTIGFVNDSILTMLPALNPKLPFDPQRDFAPISRVAGNAFGIAVSTSFPARTLQQLLVQARNNPGTIHFASGGNGSPQHVVMEMVNAAAGVNMVHVPYKGASQALTDVVGGQVPVIAQGLGVLGAQVKAGKLRVLAVTGTKRSPLIPGVPTTNEAGLPGFEFSTWFAVVAPAGTPRAIIDRLNHEIQFVARLPEVHEPLVQQGYDVDPGSPEQLAAAIHEGRARMVGIVNAVGIKAD
jgi:tripartite-type tricarboxylate transporter receptor subunit TctC